MTIRITLFKFRYRSYVYDDETGLYYLNSRYYDAGVGRFLNADTSSVITASMAALTDKNLFSYCDSNPVMRIDVTGMVWETVFDLLSLGVSVVEVAINPADPWNWAAVVGDTIDLVPFVTGLGETAKVAKFIKKADATKENLQIVEIAKAKDFTEEALDTVKALDRSSGYTKSTATAGIQIHKGYKATPPYESLGKEYRGIQGVRMDYVDFASKTIYELKPMNPKSLRMGVRQLERYGMMMDGMYKLRLEVY